MLDQQKTTGGLALWWHWALAILMNVPSLLHLGLHDPFVDPRQLQQAQLALLILYGAGLVISTWLSVRRHRRPRLIDPFASPEVVMVLVGVLLSFWWPGQALAALGLLLLHMLRAYMWLVRLPIPPGLVFVGSFLLLIAAGTALLKLPAATPLGQPISTVDAFFTITSAISQTGLVVRPTGSGFTRFGQIIILIWIQVGALGVIVFGALLATVIGSAFGLRATKTLAEGTEQGWAGQLSLQRLVTFIIIFTHVAEVIGAVVIYFGWPDAEAHWPGRPADFNTVGDRVYHSIFFSVSAFCNAGFVTTGDSLQGLRTGWMPHLVIAPLIVLGSIGFPVLDNMRQVLWARFRGVRTRGGALIRLSLNSKIVLTTTAALYLFGFTTIFISEVTQAHIPFEVAVLDAHFMNINRTSGFDTIAPGEMGLLSRLVLIFLMFIGGSPGSVAGGIKVMVFAVLVLTVWATIRGRQETTAFGRTIPDLVVRKCATLIVLCLSTVMVVTGVLAATDAGPGRQSLGPLLFEATSAFGTTGLSMGITPELSVPGRIALCVAMFVGRVGPLAVTASLASIAWRRAVRIEYPSEDVVVY